MIAHMIPETYRYIFGNVNDASFIHDLEAHFLDVNRIACERLGYTRDAVEIRIKR
ncbi:MAG: PAS domain S-box protein [Chloroflexi bacterium]|nr:PAS domain S-box protein [Chloroflexota bacterium]